MDKRLELQAIFEEILESRNIYFQPPSTVRMRYPAIRYSLNTIDPTYANDGMYQTKPSYQVILIDEDPDTRYLEKILRIPYCKFNRFYIADNLNHWVFTIYNY